MGVPTYKYEQYIDVESDAHRLHENMFHYTALSCLQIAFSVNWLLARTEHVTRRPSDEMFRAMNIHRRRVVNNRQGATVCVDLQAEKK